MNIIKNPKFKFIERRKLAFTCSAILLLAGIISLIVKGGPSYSIDFEGGTLIQLRFLKPVDTAVLRHSLESIGYGDATIQEFGSPREVLIRVKQAKKSKTSQESLVPEIVGAIRAVFDKQIGKGRTIDINAIGPKELALDLGTLSVFKDNQEGAEKLAKKIVERRNALGGLFPSVSALLSVPGIPAEAADYFKNKAYASNLIVVRQEMVGPKVGKDLRGKAILSIFWAMLGILIYVSVRFRFRFAVAAVVALIHDVSITVGLFSLFNREFSLTVVAALLTIVGYSLNDTIVVYDRIRENSKSMRHLPYAQQLNTSINLTLSRTLLTSFTTFIVVLALFVLGGEVIRDFALALMIGVVVGTYSSIFVASPIVYEWEMHSKKRRKRKQIASGRPAAQAAGLPKRRR